MKFIKIILASFLILTLGSCKNNTTANVEVTNDVEDNAAFEEYLDKEFVEMMEADYLTMHYTVKDYKAYGIEKPEPTLGVVKLEDYQDFIDDAETMLEELAAFDINTLSNRQKIDYRVLKNYLENYKVLHEYPLFDNYFDPASGITDNLITNFIEFDFRSEEDIQDYLLLLESVPAYVESAVEFTKYQAGEGYFMNDDAVDYVIESIDRFVSKVEDNELIVDFNNEMEAFDLETSLKDEYIAKNKELVINGFIPSYLSIKEALLSLKGARKHEGGIALYQDGKDYYEVLIKNKASNDLSLYDQISLIEKYLNNELKELRKLYAKNPNMFDADYESAAEFENAESILEFVKGKMDEHYPEGPEVTYEISYLDPSVANESTLAYYLSPPIDDLTRNIIKVNPNSQQENIELYTTASHEGFPGHLYQFTYYLNSNPHPIRSALSNIGYTEGWAMYVETQSTYLLDLTKAEAFLYNLDIKFNYIVSSAIDIGVNGLGWDIDKTRDWLKQYGYEDYAQDFYDQALMMPAVLVPYGMGILQMYELRNKVETKLAKKFDEIEFNKLLLDNGDRPFYIISEEIDTYLKSK